MMAARTWPGRGAGAAGPDSGLAAGPLAVAAWPVAAGSLAAAVRNGGVDVPVTRYRREGSGSESSHGAEPSAVVSTPVARPEPSTPSSPSFADIRPYQ